MKLKNTILAVSFLLTTISAQAAVGFEPQATCMVSLTRVYVDGTKKSHEEFAAQKVAFTLAPKDFYERGNVTMKNEDYEVRLNLVIQAKGSRMNPGDARLMVESTLIQNNANVPTVLAQTNSTSDTVSAQMDASLFAKLPLSVHSELTNPNFLTAVLRGGQSKVSLNDGVKTGLIEDGYARVATVDCFLPRAK